MPMASWDGSRVARICHWHGRVTRVRNEKISGDRNEADVERLFLHLLSEETRILELLHRKVVTVSAIFGNILVAWFKNLSWRWLSRSYHQFVVHISSRYAYVYVHMYIHSRWLGEDMWHDPWSEPQRIEYWKIGEEIILRKKVITSIINL